MPEGAAGGKPTRNMKTRSEEILEEGNSDRAYLGIDGTMGDAQDVLHPFLSSVYGEHCRLCGLARAYWKHDD